MAYKSLAQRYHPDREHGDEERFREIQKAYDVLGDKDKRAYYDETGKYDFHPLEDEAMSHIISMFSQLIDQNAQVPDVIEAVRKAVTDNIASLRREILTLESRCSGYKNKKGKIKCSAEINCYEQVLDQNIEKLDGQANNGKHLIEVFNVVLKILEDYEDTTPKPIPMHMGHGTGSTATTTFYVR